MGRTLASQQGQQDPGGKHRVEEREGIAGQHQSIAGAISRAIRVFRRDPDRLAARARGQMLGDPAVCQGFAVEDRLEILALPIQVVALGHHPHAHGVLGQRNVPEPALAGQVRHGGRAFVVARIPEGAPVVGPDRDLVQPRIGNYPAEFGRGETMPPATVDGDRSADRKGLAALLDHQALAAPAVHQQALGGSPHQHSRALLDRVVQHHLVEFATHHLPRLRGRVIEMLEEVERRRNPAVHGRELHAVLLDEAGRAQPVDHPDAFQRKVAIRQQGLADLVAREALALYHEHVAPLGGQDRRGRGPGRAAPQDQRVQIPVQR